MTRGLNKAERLTEMIWLYSQRAYKDVELANRFGVDKSTIGRHRKELEDRFPFMQDENGGWYIDSSDQLSAIRLTLPQALALFLPAQKASRQTRLFQQHTADALDKLSTILKPPMTEKIVQAADRILADSEDASHTKILERILEGWVDGFKLEIEYQADQNRPPFVHKFHPYLIQPSVWSDSTYLIGYSETSKKKLALKIMRMQRVSILPETFEMPADFDEEQLLKHAWGIWYSDQPHQTVKLKFRPGIATQRLQESVWHPLEQVETTADGGALWQAPVAEWREMRPWIQGWGSQCEVLEPAELRAEVRRELLRQMETYGLATAKPDKDDPDYHKKRAKSLFGG